jgi:hypothetical protein
MIPSNILDLISAHHSARRARFGHVDFERVGDCLTEAGEQRYFEAARWMEDGFERVEPFHDLMRFLCRVDFMRPFSRLTIYGLFLWDSTGNRGFVSRSTTLNSDVVTDCWVARAEPENLRSAIGFLKYLVKWLFWVGLFVTGWGKVASGFMTLSASKNLEAKRDGKAVACLEISNIMTDVRYRKKGFGNAHMVAVCALATALDMPVKLTTADRDNVGFHERFGFVDQGRIPGLPKRCPWFNWMVYEPRNTPMTAEWAGRLLRIN